MSRAELVGWVQLSVWSVLALAALVTARVRRDRTTAWLAGTFACFALVVVATYYAPPAGGGLRTLVTKAVIVLTALFPYLLYRFVVTMVPPPRWEWYAVHLLTEATVLAAVFLPALPVEDAPRPLWLQLFTGLTIVQWVFILGRVGWRLWRSGRGQPGVARKRMRTMAFASGLLALLLAYSTYGAQRPETSPARVAAQLATLLPGPLFFIAFAPPRTLRSSWRRRDEQAFREMEIGLVRAVSRAEIADSLLPRIARFVGGTGAALLDLDGGTIGSHSFGDEEVEEVGSNLPVVLERYEPVVTGTRYSLLMENGWLVVGTGPFTPFFGTDELQTLSATSVLADLALGRAKLFELEQQARAAMTDFVAIASHDLRTPVTVIQGMADLMSTDWETLPDEQKREFIDAIGRQVRHLERLIRDLLTTSQLDVQETEVLPEPVDMLAAAREAARSVAPDEDIKVWASGGVVATADPDHVARMLENYIRNATVYGAPPVEVEVHGQRQWVIVRVRDQGPGVPEEFVSKLFEKFARADKKRSKAVQGTGLGLSIVRGLARANGGYAWYEHNEPQGACFAFRLPRIESERAGARKTKKR